MHAVDILYNSGSEADGKRIKRLARIFRSYYARNRQQLTQQGSLAIQVVTPSSRLPPTQRPMQAATLSASHRSHVASMQPARSAPTLSHSHIRTASQMQPSAHPTPTEEDEGVSESEEEEVDDEDEDEEEEEEDVEDEMEQHADEHSQYGHSSVHNNNTHADDQELHRSISMHLRAPTPQHAKTPYSSPVSVQSVHTSLPYTPSSRAQPQRARTAARTPVAMQAQRMLHSQSLQSARSQTGTPQPRVSKNNMPQAFSFSPSHAQRDQRPHPSVYQQSSSPSHLHPYRPATPCRPYLVDAPALHAAPMEDRWSRLKASLSLFLQQTVLLTKRSNITFNRLPMVKVGRFMQVGRCSLCDACVLCVSARVHVCPVAQWMDIHAYLSYTSHTSGARHSDRSHVLPPR